MKLLTIFLCLLILVECVLCGRWMRLYKALRKKRAKTVPTKKSKPEKFAQSTTPRLKSVESEWESIPTPRKSEGDKFYYDHDVKPTIHPGDKWESIPVPQRSKNSKNEIYHDRNTEPTIDPGEKWEAIPSPRRSESDVSYNPDSKVYPRDEWEAIPNPREFERHENKGRSHADLTVYPNDKRKSIPNPRKSADIEYEFYYDPHLVPTIYPGDTWEAIPTPVIRIKQKNSDVPMKMDKQWNSEPATSRRDPTFVYDKEPSKGPNDAWEHIPHPKSPTTSIPKPKVTWRTRLPAPQPSIIRAPTQAPRRPFKHITTTVIPSKKPLENPALLARLRFPTFPTRSAVHKNLFSNNGHSIFSEDNQMPRPTRQRTWKSAKNQETEALDKDNPTQDSDSGTQKKRTT